jgi:hypothetical protein
MSLSGASDRSDTVASKTSKQSANVAKKTAAKRVAAKAASKSQSRKNEKPTLLSGGNPQIAKGDGDVPVQAFIAAMPGWKSDVGRRLDALIVQTVPGVRKAVRWNTPFYGMAGKGWFLGFHCFTKYIKVVFLSGTSLRPLPPVESKNQGTRYFHIHENDTLDEELFANWIRQASKLPGEALF